MGPAGAMGSSTRHMTRAQWLSLRIEGDGRDMMWCHSAVVQTKRAVHRARMQWMGRPMALVQWLGIQTELSVAERR